MLAFQRKTGAQMIKIGKIKRGGNTIFAESAGAKEDDRGN